MSLNLLILHGRFGRDPELKELQGQNGPFKKATFSIAVSRDFGDECDWFFCSMIGKRAEVIDKYFHKGSEIIVKGRFESYKPKNDPDHISWVLNVSDFDFAGSNKSNSSAGSAPATAATTPTQGSINDLPDSFEEAEDDIPF